MITVRYFAAAAEAAGVDSEQLPAGSAAQVRAAMVGAHGAALDRVLGRCSLLADGTRVDGDDPVPRGDHAGRAAPVRRRLSQPPIALIGRSGCRKLGSSMS